MAFGDAYMAFRFRTAHDYAYRNGFFTGWPNFHQAQYSGPRRIVYGHFFLRDDVVDWRDVPRSEYGNPDSVRARLTGAHDYARRQGYEQGFPNFHEANYGDGVVYGTLLVVPGACVWRDVPAVELGLGYGDPSKFPVRHWFAGANDYAVRNGLGAAMPNGHYANYNGRWVCGVFFFLPGTYEWRDIRGRDLGLEDIYPPPKPPPPPPIVKVPSIVGWSFDAAKTAVESAKLTFYPSWEPDANPFDPDIRKQMLVLRHAPSGGTDVFEWSRVSVHFGVGVPTGGPEEAMEWIAPPPVILSPEDPQPAPQRLLAEVPPPRTGAAIAAAWSNSCAGGDRFENNCAHFLSNALIGAGYNELLTLGARCNPARRPIRAREMNQWFANMVRSMPAGRTSNQLQRGTGWWLAFQLNETAYWGGHVALLDSDRWEFYGTGWHGRWQQFLYQW